MLPPRLLSLSLSLKTGSNNSLIIQIPTSPAYRVSSLCLLAWPGLPVNYYYFSLEKPKRKNEMPKRMQSQLELKLEAEDVVDSLSCAWSVSGRDRVAAVALFLLPPLSI